MTAEYEVCPLEELPPGNGAHRQGGRNHGRRLQLRRRAVRARGSLLARRRAALRGRLRLRGEGCRVPASRFSTSRRGARSLCRPTSRSTRSRSACATTAWSSSRRERGASAFGRSGARAGAARRGRPSIGPHRVSDDGLWQRGGWSIDVRGKPSPPRSFARRSTSGVTGRGALVGRWRT